MVSKLKTLLLAGMALPLAASLALAQTAAPQTVPAAAPAAAPAVTSSTAAPDTAKQPGAIKTTPAAKKAEFEKNGTRGKAAAADATRKTDGKKTDGKATADAKAKTSAVKSHHKAKHPAADQKTSAAGDNAKTTDGTPAKKL